MRGPLHHVHLSPRSWVHLLFQSITVGHRFEFHANGVGDGDDGSSLECEGGQHRTELMHFERVITFHQHIPAPITDADDERVDLEIGWRLPRAKDLQDSLLCIFVLEGASPCGRSFQVIMYCIQLISLSPGAELLASWSARYTPRGIPASSDITKKF
jgi:hypothetical protein